MPPLDNTRNWPEFDRRKAVRAAPIVNVAEFAGAGTCRVLFVSVEGGRVEPYVCHDEAVTDKAAIGWYAIVLSDDTKTAMTKEDFEADYVKRAAAA